MATNEQYQDDYYTETQWKRKPSPEKLPESIYHMRVQKIQTEEDQAHSVEIEAEPLTPTTDIDDSQKGYFKDEKQLWKFCPSCPQKEHSSFMSAEDAWAYDDQIFQFVSHYTDKAIRIMNGMDRFIPYIQGVSILWAANEPPVGEDTGVAHSSALTREHLEMVRDRAGLGKIDMIEVKFNKVPRAYKKKKESLRTKILHFLGKVF